VLRACLPGLEGGWNFELDHLILLNL
jgi:hypothetical protein